MNLKSKEFYINMKDSDIPLWNPLYSFDEQDDDVKQFWFNEADKLTNGVNVNGVYIHPWLYWHINYWKMMLDVEDKSSPTGFSRIPGHTSLRDNEWMFTEFLQKAEAENKGIFMFGTRRFGKALLNSEVLYLEDREKKIGDIVVGDWIYDDEGKLTEVTGVYPQGKVMTYRVTFEDGRNVICCGNHLWKVWYHGDWKIRTLKSIIGIDYKSLSIPIGEALEYPVCRLPIAPAAYGAMVASFLCGNEPDVPFDANLNRIFLRSSIEQKKVFIDSLIRSFNSVVTNDEVLELEYLHIEVIRFVQRMFWSYGWYAKLDGNKLVVSAVKRKLRIQNIEVYGKKNATCITVDNMTKLFLTTNYIVTHNTAIMSSYLARNATMTYNLTHNVIGSSKEDLASMAEYLEFGLDNLPEFLRINRTGNDWGKEVILGTKSLSNIRDIHARVRIMNIDSGKTGASLKTAGGTPYTSIYDEVGKFPVLGAYLAGKPAHMMHGKMRGMIILSGCCCAGTQVYNKYGESCNIENLGFSDGIVGFDVAVNDVVGQEIEAIKLPAKKKCYRITCKDEKKVERVLECSWDHPILCEKPSGRDNQYQGFVAAKFLLKGEKIGVYDFSKGQIWAEVVKVESIGVQTVYNVTASGTHTYLANDFITHNTGGNVEKSQDAQKIMNAPDDYGFIVMDYDILNKRTTKPTWRICKSGCFVPAQMSHAYEKKKITLDKYLGIEKAPDLKKIKIAVSDFDKNTDILKKRLDELVQKDRALFVQEKMAFPLTVDDCFLNQNVNRFPVEDALLHKNRILEEGREGKLVDIYQVDGQRMGWNFSEKLLAPYPFKGGNIDCPVVMYENPPEEGGIFDFSYVAGCLLPGEKVLTDMGLMNVEDICIDRKLINKDGDLVSINALLRCKKKDEDVYEIKVGNSYRKTIFTGEHPLYISHHKTRPDHRMDESLLEFGFINVKDIRENDWIKYPNLYSKEVENPIINPFEESVDFWWFVGYWLGNGWCNYKTNAGYIEIAVNENDLYTVDRIEDIAKRIFKSIARKRKRRGCFSICFRNDKLSYWLNNNFGKYSYGKIIPEAVKYIKKDLKIALILGYFDSDGCLTIHANGYYNSEFVSVNLELIESIQDMLFSLGVVSSVSRLRKSRRGLVDGKMCDQREIYHLRMGDYSSIQFKELVSTIYNYPGVKLSKIVSSISKSKRHKNDCFISNDGKYIYFQIKSIEKKKYTGVVYNFDCETHTYLCHHITTHNCDPYKQDKANTESLGAVYVLKRHVKINDPFAYRIVASYVSRPAISDDFCRNSEILLEAYGAKCLMENADRMFETYLSRRNKEFVLLEDGEKLANKIIRTGSRQNNKLGLSPTVPNQRMLFNTVLQYCWEEVVVGYDDEGNEITQKGIYRIPDVELLDEIIAFGPGVNTDRIIAFGHALLLAKYYDDMGFMPESTTQKMNEEKRNERKRYQMGGFVTRRRNPFSSF